MAQKPRRRGHGAQARKRLLAESAGPAGGGGWARFWRACGVGAAGLHSARWQLLRALAQAWQGDDSATVQSHANRLPQGQAQDQGRTPETSQEPPNMAVCLTYPL